MSETTSLTANASPELVQNTSSDFQSADASEAPAPSTSNAKALDIDPVVSEALGNKYTLEKEIGQGAQGKIYRGKCLADGKDVAIKQLRVTSTKDWKQYELFAREAEVLASLNLPGTAKFYEAIQDLESANPISLIVQEYIHGRALQAYIDNGERFLFEHICHILIRILRVIQSLHTHEPQVIHRDIKPSNIILRYSDDPNQPIPDVYIVDFGAVANPQVQDGGSTVTGTYGYMAPEQLIGKPTAASDIYSFAVMAVYLFSGIPPEQIATQDLRLLIDPHLEHLPYEVTVFLRMMLETAPTKRLMDYDKIADTLDQFSKHNFKLDYLLQASDQEAPNKFQQILRNWADTSAPFAEFLQYFHLLPDHVENGKTNYTLEHVQSIGQSGNFTLWQNLPEKTPRYIHHVCQNTLMIDTLFLNSLESRLISIANRELYGRRDKIDARYQKRKKILNRANKIFSCIVLVQLALVLILPFTSWNQLPAFVAYSSLVSVTLAQVLYVTIALSIAICIIFYITSKVTKDGAYRQVEQILKYGRKSIATVESVEFISGAATLKSQVLGSQDFVLSQLPEYTNSLNHHIRPVWKITYAFNPPDDNDPAALHHTYYSDVPIKNLKPGDVLPILYLITPDMLPKTMRKQEKINILIEKHKCLQSKLETKCQNKINKLQEKIKTLESKDNKDDTKIAKLSSKIQEEEDKKLSHPKLKQLKYEIQSLQNKREGQIVLSLPYPLPKDSSFLQCGNAFSPAHYSSPVITTKYRAFE